MRLTSLISAIVSGAWVVHGLSLPKNNGLERRKDFYTTHEEHGHLPGLRNPSPFALLDQLGRVAMGQNPMEVLQSYNEKADDEKGARFGRASKRTGKYDSGSGGGGGGHGHGGGGGGHGHGGGGGHGHGGGGGAETTSAGILGPLGFSDIPILGKY